MDLKTLDTASASEEGSVLELHGPDGKLLIDEATNEPWSITLRGADSKEHKKMRHRYADKRLSQTLGKRGGGLKIRVEEIEDETITVLVAMTLTWNHLILDGQELICTPENARMVYTRFPWILEQVEDFVNDRTHYLGN